MADPCGCPPHPFRHGIPSLHPGEMPEEHPTVAAAAAATTPLLVAREDTSSHPALLWLGRILLTVLPITGIVLGAVYLDQCPRQPLIPIYLIILGVVALLLDLLNCLPCGDGAAWSTALIHHLQVACLLFFSAWFIAGSVWVYSIYPPDYELVGQPTFCQRTLFLFAFGVTTSLHVALGVALLFSICIMAILFFSFGAAVLPYGGHGDRGGP